MGAIRTTKLDTGHEVLAKVGRGGDLEAVRYANYEQASRRRTELVAIGIACEILDRGVAKFIAIEA